MVYKQDECKAPIYQEKKIDKNVANQIRQNQGKANEVPCSLEWLEIPILLEQYWMGRQKKNIKKNPFCYLTHKL